MKHFMLSVCLFWSLYSMAQNNHGKSQYINTSIDNGYMINADPGFIKMGVGCSGSYIIPSYLQFGSAFNYYTLSASLISYPHVDTGYSLKNINDGIDNSFSFMKLLIGYRVSIRFAESNGSFRSYFGWDRIEGLSFEPRIGMVLYDLRDNDNGNTTIIVSPRFNYIFNNFQLSVFADYGQAKRHTNIKCNTIFSISVSAGYNIRL